MENAAPANAIILSNKVPSPLSFMVWRQERLVKKKPTDAPMALMSTNQPSASRPSTGPDNDIRIQKRMALRGVP